MIDVLVPTGFIENQVLPFRLTSNLRTLIGLPLLEGRFIPAMCTIAGAMKENKADCEPILRLLMRDDIVAWYTSRSTAKNDVKTQELENQLSDRVMKNVVAIQGRLADCAPRRDGATALRTPVDKKVRELVDIATDPGKLCLMPTTFQAWL